MAGGTALKPRPCPPALTICVMDFWGLLADYHLPAIHNVQTFGSGADALTGQVVAVAIALGRIGYGVDATHRRRVGLCDVHVAIRSLACQPPPCCEPLMSACVPLFKYFAG